MVEVDVGGGIRGARAAFSCTVYETVKQLGFATSNQSLWRWEIRPADGRSWEETLGPDWKNITGLDESGPMVGGGWGQARATQDLEKYLAVVCRAVTGEGRRRWVVDPSAPAPEPVEAPLKPRRWLR